MGHSAQASLYANNDCYAKSRAHAFSSEKAGFGNGLIVGEIALLPLTLTLSLSKARFPHLENGDNSYLMREREDLR